MSESKPKSGPSEKITHDERGTTFRELKETEKHTRTQDRTYTPKKESQDKKR